MRLRVLAAVALALLSFTPAPSRAEDKKDGKSPFVHSVIFYLKSDAPSGAADEVLADCHDLLAKIPSVRLLRAGRAAEGAPAPTKKDFGVGLVILFDDIEGLKTYIDHPLHVKFVEKNGKYFDRDKLAVYDFVNAKK